MKNLMVSKVSMTVAVLALLAVFGLVGCGGGGGGSSSPGGNSTGPVPASTYNLTGVAAHGVTLGGNLIAPVTVGGHTYYYWDVSGDGTSAGVDYVTHDLLDQILNGGTDTTDTPSTNTVTLSNGMTIHLPTQAELVGLYNAKGTPTGWSGLSYGVYWTATQAASGVHNYMVLYTGLVSMLNDTSPFCVAFEVVTATTPDTTAPTVSSTSPANSSTEVAVNTAITATFSEAMTAATVTSATFTVNNGVTGTVTYSGTTATFTPSSYLAYSTTYTATITTGVKDAAGNTMASTYTWTFTTGTATTTGFTGNFLSWTGSDDASHSLMLVHVNGQTGAVTSIGGSDFFTGLAYGPDGRLYGVANDLHIINPTNGATVKVGDLQYQGGSPILMCDAAFSPNGTLYVLENASPKRIFTVNLTNAVLTYVGTPTASIRSLQFASNGTLYASFADLFTLNANDMSTVATVGHLGVYVDSLTFGSGGTLYGIDNYPSTHIYSMNLSTGLATPITVVGSSGLVSLVAERTATTYPAPTLNASAPVYKLSSPKDMDALLNMEKEIMSARKRLLP